MRRGLRHTWRLTAEARPHLKPVLFCSQAHVFRMLTSGRRAVGPPQVHALWHAFCTFCSVSRVGGDHFPAPRVGHALFCGATVLGVGEAAADERRIRLLVRLAAPGAACCGASCACAFSGAARQRGSVCLASCGWTCLSGAVSQSCICSLSCLACFQAAGAELGMPCQQRVPDTARRAVVTCRLGGRPCSHVDLLCLVLSVCLIPRAVINFKSP